MILLSDLVNEYYPLLVAKHEQTLLPSHHVALAAMQTCRTEKSKMMLVQCEQCQYQTYHPHSCGHRLCPHCQHYESQLWIERQRRKLVPADYYMMTFTLPAQLRSLAWQNQAVIYSLFFKLAWSTLKTFGLNDKKLKGLLGATGVLHTHTRELNYHVHIHFIVPAGAIDVKHNLWRKKSGSYLFNGKNLANVFHAKWIDAIKKEKLSVKETIPADWVVHGKHVGKGDKALTYLGKYLYRGVLPEKNILRNHNGEVTFKYTNNKNQRRTRTLPGTDFLLLLLKHVLPRGFRRARDFGFLHGNCKRTVMILQLISRHFVLPETKTLSSRASFCCPKCEGQMKIIATRLPNRLAHTISSQQLLPT